MHPARQMDFGTLYTDLMVEYNKGNLIMQSDRELRIFCYSKQCVYEKAWNPITTMARGLILDVEDRAIVATPFPKFFNHGEVAQAGSIPAEEFEVFDKLDGSLIIVFHHKNRWRTATKGSFQSDQAKWALGQLTGAAQRVYGSDPREDGLKWPPALVPGTTYLFEAIYPENRIVINYPEKMVGLHLLAAYRENGEELSYTDLATVAGNLGWPVVMRLRFSNFAALLEQAQELPHSEEGWVVRFVSGYRLKIKGSAYTAIHRAVFGLTPLAVWEAIMWQWDHARQKTDPRPRPEEMRKELPEEFWPDFDSIYKILHRQFDDILMKVIDLAGAVRELTDKEIAERLNDLPPEAPWVFDYRGWMKRGDNSKRDRLYSKIWKTLRPTFNKLEGYVAGTSITRVLTELQDG
jgi:RNA ligase